MLIIGWPFLIQINNNIANEEGGGIYLSELQPRRGSQLLYEVALMAAIRAVIVCNQKEIFAILQDLVRLQNG